MSRIYDEGQTRKARDLAASLGFSQTASSVEVLWYGRLTTTAGRACLGSAQIELNPRLKDVSDDEIDRTLRHELAHQLVYERHGLKVQPHGREWRAMCARLGIADESPRHTLPWEVKRRHKPYIYACAHCGLEMGRVRKMKRRVACVKCCRAYAGGRYSDEFLFRLKRIEEG